MKIFGLDYMLDNPENNNFDTTKWIEFLELVPSKVDFEFDKYDEKNIQDKINDYIEEYGTDNDSMQIYNDLPQISKYYSLKHKQKFYSLQEIRNL